MRLFLFNPNEPFSTASVAQRAKVSFKTARSEIRNLEDISLVKSRIFYKDNPKSAPGAKKIKYKGWVLDENFPYLMPLRSFLIHTGAFQPKEIIKRMNRAGKIKLLIISGVFIQDPESRVDLLVVGDNLKKGVVDSVIKSIEAELGKEIVYSAFETDDFKYRLSMFDKLIRDILDFPHQKILDRLDVDSQ